MITGIRYKIFKDGVVCPGGLLHTFESGTGTPKAVFSDAMLSTPLSNPVEMDEEGEAVLFLGEGAYRFLEQDADGVQIKAPVDGITANQSSAAASSGLATNVNVLMSTTGSSATITISADRLALMNAAGDVLVAEDVVTSINCASVGAGGLDTGSLAADTFYSIYAIANEIDGVLDNLSACISSSEFAPTVTGYDYSVRLGSVRTDSSGNKYPLAGTWDGARFSYKVVTGSNVAALPIMATGALGNISTPTYSAVAWADFAPSTAAVLHMALRVTNGTVMAAPNDDYGAYSSTTNPPPFVVNTSATASTQIDIVPESDSVHYASDSASGRLFCLGWTDGLSYTSGELAADEARLRSDLADPSGSDLMGFSHDETYTAGTVGDRLKKVVYVTDAPYLASTSKTAAENTMAIQNAMDDLAATGGGEVVVPCAGGAFKVTSLSVPNGILLRGAGSRNFEGATATNAQWTSSGSWLEITHATDSAVILQGHGSGIAGINFICVQPTPGGSWTPNTYGYCIERIASHTTIDNVMIVNASHGIYDHFTDVSGGGTQCHMKDVIVSAFSVRIKTSCVNDTMYWSNIHCRNLWYSSNSLVVAYIRANTIEWDCGYTDNLMVSGLEFFEGAESIRFTDETCLGNTHSLYNAQLNNVQFNLPEVCMTVAATDTVAVAQFSNVLSQTGNAFGYTWSDTAFQLASDGVDLEFDGLRIRDAGGQIASVGTTTGGRVKITGLTVDNYSTVSAGQVGFGVASGVALQVSSYEFQKPSGAGSRFAGAGLDNVVTDAYGSIMFLGRYSESTLNGTGSYADYSVPSSFRPGQSSVHQARLIGALNVTAAVGASTAALRMSGITTITVSGVDTATTGWKNFDTGWIDIAQSTLDALTNFGSVQVNAAVGVTVSNGSVELLFR